MRVTGPSTVDEPPSARSADVLLADGSTVHVRPISPDDADRVVALHSRFSAARER